MSNSGLEEYRRKVANGEIERKKPRNPTEQWQDNPKSLRKAVNAYCYDCSGFNTAEIKHCPIKKCPLWGHRPYQPK